MKNIFAVFLFCIICVPGIVFGQTGKAITMNFSFTTLTVGTPITITWTEEDSPNTEYTINLTGGPLGSSARTIGSIDTLSADSFTWTPTSDIQGGSGYTIVFVGNGVVQDTSSPFTLINTNYVPSTTPPKTAQLTVSETRPLIEITPPSTGTTTQKTYASFSEQIADLQNKILMLKNMILDLVTKNKKTETTKSISCTSLDSTFRYAAKDTSLNTDVARLQNFLYTKGYLSSNPTGYFGQLTVEAVKRYQTERGIRSTGEAGPLTREAIKKESCSNQ